MKELLYDGMQYSAEDKSFIYAEVELKYISTQLKTKKVEQNGYASAHTISATFTTELREFPKPKWNEYTLTLTTIHLTTLTRYSLDIKLHTLLTNAIKAENTNFVSVSYEQLKAYATRFAQEMVFKHSIAASAYGKPFYAKEAATEIKNLFEEPKDETPAEGKLNTIYSFADFANQNKSGKMTDSAEKKGVRERAIFYEEVIQALPPVIGKVIVCRDISQILFKVTGLTNDVNYEIPVSFRQASKDCMIPIPLLQKDFYWIGKRLLDGYKVSILKQYYGLNVYCNADESPRASKRKSTTFVPSAKISAQSTMIFK